jgi:CsoR family transcriptional regulator, copper-sensing transcriptional repressor
MDMSEHKAPHYGEQLPALRRIEGQVRGVVKMVEEDRYCVDILGQLRAARAALKRVEEHILRAHVEGCVADALRSGDARRQRQKLDELFEAFGRYSE